MAERFSPEPIQKKTKLAPVKERHSWIKEIDSLYYCEVCTVNPTLLRVLRASNKEEYFVNKGVPKNSDPGRKADAHMKQLSHSQSFDFAKVISGEKKTLLDSMTQQAITEKAKKEADTNVYIKEFLRAAYWLFKNEIPHTTNFESLLDLLCLQDENLCHFSQKRASNATYRSKATITEFLEIMSDVLDKETVTLLTQSISLFHGWSLLADETSLHGASLLGIYVRFIHPRSFEPTEEMIHCVPIESTKAVDIFKAIDMVVVERNLDISKLKCVSFDGAANMSSPTNGVYGLMKINWKLPDLIYQHCSAHRLQLVAKAVAKDSKIITDSLWLVQEIYKFFNNSNKKLELLKRWTHLAESKAIKLVEIAPTRWLSHGNALKRLLKLYTAIIKSFDFIQDNMNYDVNDRTRALGFLDAMLSKRTIIIFFYLDSVLSKMNTLSKLFQNKQATLSMTIMSTKGIIMELSELVSEQTSIETVTGPKVSAMIDSLKELGMEVFEPSPRRTEQVDWKLKLFQQLNEYTDSLVTELSRRFGKDTEMLIHLLPFNHHDWPNMVTDLQLKLFDTHALVDEGRHISKHISLSPQIDTTSPSKLWQSFLKDGYTRQMFPEHSFVSTLMLILPIGSCTVERCFSYSSRICSDSRAALSLNHVSDLVRISQQGPNFPKLSEIPWPFSIQELIPNNQFDRFIDDVFAHWRMSPRRL